PELDQADAETERLASGVLVAEVAPFEERVDEPVRAASRDPELVADPRERQALRLRREQLEDVEHAAGRLDGIRPPFARFTYVNRLHDGESTKRRRGCQSRSAARRRPRAPASQLPLRAPPARLRARGGR